MVVTCWSVKGGSGTTVVAAALAVLLARRRPEGCLLVDAGGDAAPALGLREHAGPGLLEWLAAGDDVGAEALGRLVSDAGRGLRLLPPGTAASLHPDTASAAAGRVLDAVTGLSATTVVDAGPPSRFATGLAAGSTVSLLVLRPCYLALRLALAAPLRPSGVVLVEEPRRSLHADDVEDVLGVPVRAIVPWDPAIARTVDAGLLGHRLPRPLASALRSAA